MKKSSNFEVCRLDVRAEWMNSGYDENGYFVSCEGCGCEMKWNPQTRNWYCPECECEMDREDYFAFIGAEPPGEKCLHSCQENYPLCKQHWCHYLIDPDDPIFS